MTANAPFSIKQLYADDQATKKLLSLEVLDRIVNLEIRHTHHDRIIDIFFPADLNDFDNFLFRMAKVNKKKELVYCSEPVNVHRITFHPYLKQNPQKHHHFRKIHLHLTGHKKPVKILGLATEEFRSQLFNIAWKHEKGVSQIGLMYDYYGEKLLEYNTQRTFQMMVENGLDIKEEIHFYYNIQELLNKLLLIDKLNSTEKYGIEACQTYLHKKRMFASVDDYFAWYKETHDENVVSEEIMDKYSVHYQRNLGDFYSSKYGFGGDKFLNPGFIKFGFDEGLMMQKINDPVYNKCLLGEFCIK